MSRYVCVHGRPLEEDDGAECCDCTIDALRARIAELEAGIREYLKSENDGVDGHCGDPDCDICESLAGLRRLLERGLKAVETNSQGETK